MSTISATRLNPSRHGDEADTPDPGGSTGSARSARERVMTKYAIRYDGRQYEYNRYHYDHLADAVAYARLMRSRPPQAESGGPVWRGEPVDAPPSDADRELMAALGVTFEAGIFRFRNFRYDHLADAVNYARRVFGTRPART
jgi:hypothetical protein